MGLLEELLKDLTGDFHFTIGIGKRPAAKITIKEKMLLIEIQDPLAAAELAIEASILQNRLKKFAHEMGKKGFKTEVKFGPLKFDV